MQQVKALVQLMIQTLLQPDTRKSDLCSTNEKVIVYFFLVLTQVIINMQKIHLLLFLELQRTHIQQERIILQVLIIRELLLVLVIEQNKDMVRRLINIRGHYQDIIEIQLKRQLMQIPQHLENSLMVLIQLLLEIMEWELLL